ncbi:MAG: helix-turn-helix domain-containing protein [Lentisphaeria bacterium]|nr:helix-turn-helix domain-containing protein [Lentisphaeria bacterium]
MADARQDDPDLFGERPGSDETLVNTEPGEISETPQISPPRPAPDGEFTADVSAAGDYLRRRRQELGLDIQTVAAETRLKPRLIEAIEAGRLEDLPQPVYPVYIAVCVKKLGMLYKVDAGAIEKITAGIKERILRQSPDDVSKSCYGHEVSEESKRREHRLLAVLLTLMFAVVLVVAAAAVFLLLMFFREPDPALTEPFDKKSLVEIQPEVKLNVTPLPVVE